MSRFVQYVNNKMNNHENKRCLRYYNHHPSADVGSLIKHPHTFPTATIYHKTIQTRLDSLRGGGLVLKFGEPE